VKALMVWNCNPLVITPNAEAIRRGMCRDDLFTVVHDQFMTDTARYADIVLPATTQIESTDVVTSWGHLYLGWNEAAIEPLGEASATASCTAGSRARWGSPSPALFDDDMTALRDALPDGRLDELRASGSCACRTRTTAGRSATARSRPRRARSSSYSDALAALGTPRCRRSSRRASRSSVTTLAAPVPVRAAHAEAAHPLPQLGVLAPARSTAAPRAGPYLELCAQDAARSGRDGDAVRVWNDRAELRVPARVTDASAAAGRRDPVRLVERAPRGRHGRELADERHADGLGRRRRVNDTLVAVGSLRRPTSADRRRVDTA
jgi:hypothetical protein